ncbi:hypothetical protein [Desulfatiglans anilini]|uniref:hypothetical protein n=1 Tax=Desulfatiglans anilini TaxID=90728 RepID=UPI001427EC7A|nr:hypothetical protein [Desulfatiglans anilini]
MANIKEIKHLRGGDLQVAAQANVRIDAEIGQKDRLLRKSNLADAWLLVHPKMWMPPAQGRISAKKLKEAGFHCRQITCTNPQKSYQSGSPWFSRRATRVNCMNSNRY